MFTYKWNESTFDKRFISDDSEYVDLVHKTIIECYKERFSFYNTVRKVEGVSGLLREDVELIVKNEHTILNTLELKDMYEALDTKKYSIVSPSNCCTYREDTVYSFSDFELFITAPPLHYGCSATITPVEDDDDFDDFDYFQEPEDRKANGKRTLDEILDDWESKAPRLSRISKRNRKFYTIMKLIWLKKLALLVLKAVNIFLLLFIAVGIYNTLQQQEKLGHVIALCIIIFIFIKSLSLSKKIKSSIPVKIHHSAEDDIVNIKEVTSSPNNGLVPTQFQENNSIVNLPVKESQVSNNSLEKVNNYHGIPYDITKLLWFYDGPNKNCYRKDEPSLIIESLPVKQGPAEPLGYYPSYQAMTPQQRFKYLSWLRDVSQIIDIGYVFTFYYGLEKHIVDGDAESAVKVIKLLKQYHDNSSFQDYSNSALIYAAIKSQDITKLDGVLLDSLPSEVFITLRYIFFKKLTSEDIIHSMKAVGFTNNRYIKSEYNLFNLTLNELLQERFNSNVYNFEIPASFSFSKIKPIPLANYGLPYKVREFEIPNVLSHTPTTAELYDLLFTTHEIVKQKLKEKRKSVVQK